MAAQIRLGGREAKCQVERVCAEAKMCKKAFATNILLVSARHGLSRGATNWFQEAVRTAAKQQKSVCVS